jgi:glycosyltransferase involved in cell wall biosynthesis
MLRKKIIMHYCGSDIRLVEVETKRNPYNYLIRFERDHPKHDRRKKRMMRWQRLWVHRVIAIRNRYADAATVFPEHKIIRDIWINNIVDLRTYQPHSFETKEVPLIVHAPTNEEIKGTVYIERAIRALKDEGYQFDYRRLVGLSHEEAMRIYRDEADIIVDAVIMGGFGSLAVEGMYFGKPVCGYLIESVRREMYPDCPIYLVTIDNLKERLGWLISHPEERMRLGKEGRAFVERHFDREKLNQRLWSIYQTLWH